MAEPQPLAAAPDAEPPVAAQAAAVAPDAVALRAARGAALDVAVPHAALAVAAEPDVMVPHVVPQLAEVPDAVVLRAAQPDAEARHAGPRPGVGPDAVARRGVLLEARPPAAPLAVLPVVRLAAPYAQDELAERRPAGRDGRAEPAAWRHPVARLGCPDLPRPELGHSAAVPARHD